MNNAAGRRPAASVIRRCREGANPPIRQLFAFGCPPDGIVVFLRLFGSIAQHPVAHVLTHTICPVPVSTILSFTVGAVPIGPIEIRTATRALGKRRRRRDRAQDGNFCPLT